MEPKDSITIRRWMRAPYGEVGGAIIPLSVAKDALERGGYQTRMVNGELQCFVEIEITDPDIIAKLAAQAKSFSISSKEGKKDG